MSYRDPLYDSPSASGAEGFGERPTEGTNETSGLDTARQKGEEMADKMGDAYQQAAGQVSDKGQHLADSARQAGGQAQQKADEGMDRAASGLGQAAETLREQGQQRGGTVGNVAGTTADKLDLASQYLRDKDTDQLLNDLESLVRRKPVESVLTAAGIGFVLSKLFR
jgi:ElaB/YqjD/DUF883 family membrane-anchored ribosome-binding protein